MPVCSPQPQIVEGELHEVEREIKRQLRPPAYDAGDRQRQYEDVNGLRMS
jgi:hypothetical protein